MSQRFDIMPTVYSTTPSLYRVGATFMDENRALRGRRNRYTGSTPGHEAVRSFDFDRVAHFGHDDTGTLFLSGDAAVFNAN